MNEAAFQILDHVILHSGNTLVILYKRGIGCTWRTCFGQIVLKHAEQYNSDLPTLNLSLILPNCFVYKAIFTSTSPVDFLTSNSPPLFSRLTSQIHKTHFLFEHNGLFIICFPSVWFNLIHIVLKRVLTIPDDKHNV